MSEVYCINNTTNDSITDLPLSLTSLSSLNIFSNNKQQLAPISTPSTICTGIADDFSPGSFLIGVPSPMVTSLIGLNTDSAESPGFMDGETSNVSTPNPPTTASPAQLFNIQSNDSYIPKDDFSSLCELIVPKKVRKDRQVDAILVLKDQLSHFKKLAYLESTNNYSLSSSSPEELVLSFLSVHSTNKNLIVSGVIKVENVVPNETKYFDIKRTHDQSAQVEIPIRILKSPKNVGGKGELLQLTAELCANWNGRPFHASVRTDLRYENYRRTNSGKTSNNMLIPANMSISTINVSTPDHDLTMENNSNSTTLAMKRPSKRQRTNSNGGSVYSDAKDLLATYNNSRPTVVFGVKRGRCSTGCDCDQFRNSDLGNPGGKCHNCGHYPSEHENLGATSCPMSPPTLPTNTVITASTGMSRANPYLEDFASNLVRYVASLDSVNAMIDILDRVNIPMFLKKCEKDCRFIYLKGNPAFHKMIGLAKIEGCAVEEIEKVSSSKKFVQSDLMASSTPGDLIRHIVNVRDQSTITFKLFQRGCSMILVGASLPVDEED